MEAALVDLRFEGLAPLLQIGGGSKVVGALLLVLLEGDGGRGGQVGELDVEVEGEEGLGLEGGFDEAAVVDGDGDIALVHAVGLAGGEQLARGAGRSVGVKRVGDLHRLQNVITKIQSHSSIA